VLCPKPKDRDVADVVGPPDLDQRLPTFEAGGSNIGREDVANRPGSICASHGEIFRAVIAR